MSVFCICGVCIPYTAILPIIIIFLKYIWDVICKTFGWENFFDKKKAVAKSDHGEVTEGHCSGGVCSLPAKTKDVPIPESPPFYLGGNDVTWQQLLKSSSKKPLIVRFTATWCGPCKKIEPIFNSLGAENQALATFVSVDVDDYPDFMNEYSISGIPYVLSFKDGVVIDQYKGSNEEGLKNILLTSIQSAESVQS